jgi:hypothetical protein
MSLIEIEIEKQREIVKPDQQILGFKLSKVARLGPEAPNDCNRDIGILGKNADGRATHRRKFRSANSRLLLFQDAATFANDQLIA